MDKLELIGNWVIRNGNYHYYVNEEEVGFIFPGDNGGWWEGQTFHIAGTCPQRFRLLAERLYGKIDSLVKRLDPLGRITVKHSAELPVSDDDKDDMTREDFIKALESLGFVVGENYYTYTRRGCSKGHTVWSSHISIYASNVSVIFQGWDMNVNCSGMSFKMAWMFIDGVLKALETFKPFEPPKFEDVTE